MAQFYTEAVDKEERDLVNIRLYDDIKDLPGDELPGEMKGSPLSAVSHKSRGW